MTPLAFSKTTVLGVTLAVVLVGLTLGWYFGGKTERAVLVALAVATPLSTAAILQEGARWRAWFPPTFHAYMLWRAGAPGWWLVASVPIWLGLGLGCALARKKLALASALLGSALAVMLIFR